MFEHLECRRLMAGTAVTFSNGAVLVDASGGSDTLNVVEHNGAVHVETSHPVASYDFPVATSIKINGSGTSDEIFFTGNTIGATILAGGAGDSISVDDQGTGSSFADAGGGADSVVVIHSNNTTVIGSGGDDEFFLNTDHANPTTGGNNDHVFVSGDGGKDFFGIGAGTVTILDLSKQDATGIA